MRLLTLLVTAILIAGAAVTTRAQASSSADIPSLNLPVSLDRIRQGLDRAPLVTLRGLNDLAPAEAPHFKVAIEERRRLEDLLTTLDFKAGPVPAGGVYGYEQQRRLFPTTDNPLVQPWAAFSTSELLTVTVENIIRKYAGDGLIGALSDSRRAGAQRAAQDEVAQALSDFCNAQPRQGADIEACSMTPANR